MLFHFVRAKLTIIVFNCNWNINEYENKCTLIKLKQCQIIYAGQETKAKL